MTNTELREKTREMVKYMLPDDVRDDNDAVDSYTDTMVTITKKYHKSRIKKKTKK